MRIYWIRHGEMETARIRDQFRGTPDRDTLNQLLDQQMEGPLSEKGKSEAVAAARELARRPIKSIWSSSMIRARQTADALASITGHGIKETHDLREVRPGMLSEDDLLWKFILTVSSLPTVPRRAKSAVLGGSLIPAMYYRWERGRSRGGETSAEFHERLSRAVAAIKGAHAPGDEIAVFCHGYVITYLADRFCASGPRIRVSRYVRNGSITITDVQPDGTLRLREFAAARHLG